MTTFLAEFRDVLERGEDLPTLPDVVLELHAVLDDVNVGPAEIARIVDRDPALTTRLLRVANSAAFNRGAPVGNVVAAVQLIGVRQVQATCLVLSVVNAFSAGSGALNHRVFWTHCGTVGFMARHLASRCGPSVAADEMYVAGLLHDVGLLVLDQYFPDQLRETMEVAALGGEPLWKAEDIVLGTDHGEIGALLLGRWSLPESIVHAVGAHHHPDTAAPEHHVAAQLVSAAETICAVGGAELTVETLGDVDAEATLAALDRPPALDDVMAEVAKARTNAAVFA